MRCRICDALLTEREIMLKDKQSGEHYDTCAVCLEAEREALYELMDDTGIDYCTNYSTGIET